MDNLQETLQVSIPVDVFDRIEKYLSSKLPEGEPAAILQILEDLELDRTYQQYFGNEKTEQ